MQTLDGPISVRFAELGESSVTLEINGEPAKFPIPEPGRGAGDQRQRNSRSALPITIKSDTPIAAAQKIGLMKPSAASGTPSAL